MRTMIDIGDRKRLPGATAVRFTTVGDPTIVAGSRTVTFVFSDETVDRYGDIIRAKGWVLDNYKKNNIVLFGHDAGSVENVIGSAHNVRVQGTKLIGDIEFAPADANPNAEAVYQMVKGGFLKTVSVGFSPIEWEYTKDKSRPGGIDYNSAELLETSIVPVPANPNAVALAKAAGIDVDRLGLVVRKELAAPAPDEAAAREQRAAAARARVGEFRDFGEFAQAIARSAAPSGQMDPRLVRATRATGLNEDDPTQGGFAIPTLFLDELIPEIFAESQLAKLVDLRETSKPIADVRIPGFDETTRADGGRLGGVLSTWLTDGSTIPTNFPRFRNLAFQGNSLFVAVIASSELASDSLLGSYLKEAIISEFGFRLDQTIITGTGAGVPLGIASAPATILVPKAVGQASKTIVAENIQNMWARMPGPLRRTCIFAGNSDVETQLNQGGYNGIYAPAGSDGDTQPRIF